jgi:hypothetical protein
MSISAAGFLKWLEVFNVKSGGAAASGTVNSGTADQVAYYAATGDAVSGTSTIPTAVQDNITRLGTIGENFVCTGSGTFSQTAGIIGTTTNNSASTGSVGEYADAFRGGFSSISFTTGVPVNIESITLTAGDWDIWGNVAFQVDSGVTVLQAGVAGLSTTSGTLPGAANRIGFDFGTAGVVPAGGQGNAFNVKALRLLTSSTTTVYLVASADFTTSTCAGLGGLAARRRR